jgi:DNA (cytosine-5)-methyltransferase 1
MVKKILIGCSGLGGESNEWDDEKYQITHVEIDKKIADNLALRKPNRHIVNMCAFEYLLNCYKEFDFIWFSPPCQGNSRMIRSGRNRKPRFPDLRIYELKIFLDYNFTGDYVIENVIPYYEPLIEPTAKISRHLFWSNFPIDSKIEINQPLDFINRGSVADAQIFKEWLGIHYEGNIYYNGNHCPVQVLRNCVHPKIGNHILKQLIEYREKNGTY